MAIFVQDGIRLGVEVKFLEDKMKTIGLRLAERRKKLGVTAQEMAKKLGVGEATIRRIEHGSHASNFQTIAAYSSAVGFALNEVMNDKIDATPVRKPTNAELLGAVKSALSIADNPRILKFMDLLEKEPFLAEIINLSDEELRLLKQAYESIKTILPGASVEAIKKQKK